MKVGTNRQKQKPTDVFFKVNTDHTWWFTRGEDYLLYAQKALAEERESFCLLNLQHAVEFFFKALIIYHSGHHPHTRNPYTLMHIARLYTPEVQNIFPRGHVKTVKELTLFTYLNPYRFNNDEPGKELLTILLQRVMSLKNLIQRSQGTRVKDTP